MARKRKRKLKFRRLALFVILIAIIVFLFLAVKDTNFASTEKSNDKDTIIEPDNKISLIMVGDALIHSSVYDDAYEDGVYNFNKMLSLVKPIVEDYDLAFYNQETILGGTDLGLSSYPAFNSPQEVGDAFINAGFNLVSLANNHTLDRGSEAIISSNNYWNSKQKLVETFKTLPVVDWSWWAVYGFYDYLHTKAKFLSRRGFNSNYSYVANMSGGFECLHIPLKDESEGLFIVVENDSSGKEVKKHKCWLYLQIETIVGADKTNLEIRLKVANDNKNYTRANTYDLKYKFLNEYVYGHTNFVKPASLRTGRWMTVGIYDVQFGKNEGICFLMRALKNAIADYYKILRNYNEKENPNGNKMCSKE